MKRRKITSAKAHLPPPPPPPIPLPIALPIKPSFLLNSKTPKEELKDVYEANYSDENRSDDDIEEESTESTNPTTTTTINSTDSIMEMPSDETTLQQTVLKVIGLKKVLYFYGDRFAITVLVFMIYRFHFRLKS